MKRELKYRMELTEDEALDLLSDRVSHSEKGRWYLAITFFSAGFIGALVIALVFESLNTWISLLLMVVCFAPGLWLLVKHYKWCSEQARKQLSDYKVK